MLYMYQRGLQDAILNKTGRPECDRQDGDERTQAPNVHQQRWGDWGGVICFSAQPKHVAGCGSDEMQKLASANMPIKSFRQQKKGKKKGKDVEQSKLCMDLPALWVLLSAGTRGWEKAGSDDSRTGSVVQHGTANGKPELCAWHLIPVPVPRFPQFCKENGICR